MKKLNITKERFNSSRYFQTKYGKLEYVSESGNLYKTSKGQVLKLVKESDEDGLDILKSRLDVVASKYDEGVINIEFEKHEFFKGRHLHVWFPDSWDDQEMVDAAYDEFYDIYREMQDAEVIWCDDESSNEYWFVDAPER